MPQKKLIEELKEAYTKIIRKKLDNEIEYLTILRCGIKNSRGFEDIENIENFKDLDLDLWINGGYIFRSIIEEIYGTKTKKDIIDIDILVKRLSSTPYVPRGWIQRRTTYNNPYLLKGDYRIDISDLQNYHSLVFSGDKPTIENLLKNTPLNVQSIAYNLSKDLLIGDTGILAINSQEVKINNLIEAEYEAKERNMTLEDYVKNKADQLNFKAICPKCLGFLTFLKNIMVV